MSSVISMLQQATNSAGTGMTAADRDNPHDARDEQEIARRAAPLGSGGWLGDG